MPLIMLALWTSVAQRGAVRGYTLGGLHRVLPRRADRPQADRQLGRVADQRGHPHGRDVDAPAAPDPSVLRLRGEPVAALPFRSLVALPVAVVLLVSSGASALTTDPLQLALLVPSIVLAWLITFGIMFAIGCARVLDDADDRRSSTLYFALYSLFSGYMHADGHHGREVPAIARDRRVAAVLLRCSARRSS